MPQFQPRPLVVIRNQLLAFMVLHLLGSCVPMSTTQHALTAVNPSTSITIPATRAPISQIKPINLNSPAR
ncbi:hypothetical protein EOE67_12855 [Rheinheimera riviphila]|uniref:Uncharacterized protein n=1 Tax=Rheinheimera riviphila TaxID=1834037 RepID=A0A437QMQ0_9GAMM|nr:hypothetical protein [Rheinheimera riviphila]RVU35710.1 hypothetical protein EOE67_12855 [Rheinheimera riviphila]